MGFVDGILSACVPCQGKTTSHLACLRISDCIALVSGRGGFLRDLPFLVINWMVGIALALANTA